MEAFDDAGRRGDFGSLQEWSILRSTGMIFWIILSYAWETAVIILLFPKEDPEKFIGYAGVSYKFRPAIRVWKNLVL